MTFRTWEVLFFFVTFAKSLFCHTAGSNCGTSRCRYRSRRNCVAIRTDFARSAIDFFELRYVTRACFGKHARARNKNYCIVILLSLIITTELNALSASNCNAWVEDVCTLSGGIVHTALKTHGNLSVGRETA